MRALVHDLVMIGLRLGGEILEVEGSVIGVDSADCDSDKGREIS